MKKLLLIILSATLVLLFTACSGGGKYAFEKTKWGMTLQEVNASTNRSIRTDSSGNAYTDEVGEVEGLPENTVKVKTIFYYFGKDKGLTEVLLDTVPIGRNDAKSTTDALIKYCNDKYTYVSRNGNSYIWDTGNGSIAITPFNSVIKISFSQK